jgi:hypothetical protein
MTNQTRNIPRKGEGPGRVYEHAVAANTLIFAGMACIRIAANGYAGIATPGASAKFLGIAEAECNNLTGSDLGGAAGAGKVKIVRSGVVVLPVARATSVFAKTDGDVQVYAFDGSTFTTDAGTNNVPIGKVVEIPAEAIGAASADLPVEIIATTL